MDKQDIKKVVYEKFIKQLKDKAEKQPEKVEETQEKPKKGNMRRGKK